MSPNCRQKSFSVYFEIPNVTSSRLPKKDLKSFDEQTRANKCTRKEEKEPPAESIYAHVYSITSNGIKEKEKKRRKIPKKSIITGPALALDRRRNFSRRWID
jgi:hypothetical protein